jgi:phenylacetate-CoA ligase
VGDRCGLVWGAHQDLGEPSAQPGWRQSFRRFAAGKEILACTVMDEGALAQFHRTLMHFQPRVLYGYPNAMCHFLDYLRARGDEPVRVERVFCTAERLTEDQRRALAKGFGAEVFNLYCTREHGCIAFECSQHRGLHIDAGSVFLEILCGTRRAEPGEIGDIVVTDLLNRGMPFVRYRIGDRGALADAPCACGCALPLLLSLDGRVTDLLRRPDGSSVSGVMLVDLCMDAPEVRHLQIIQEALDRVRVRVEPGAGYGDAVRDRIVREVRGYMGELQVVVEPVVAIARNPHSGKFQEVICGLGEATGEGRRGR